MADCSLRVRLPGPVRSGERLLLTVDGAACPGPAPLTAAAPLPALRAGDVLAAGEQALLRVEARQWCPGNPSAPVYLLEALTAAGAEELDLVRTRQGFALAWVTLSDKGAAGLRADASGPLIETLVAGVLPLCLARGFVLPDEAGPLRALLADLALAQGFDLVLTTGGTGVAPRDVTPEATAAIIDRRLPGFERAMTAASLAKTPYCAVSRAVAGILGQALVVNLPGSPKAVKECLEPLLPALRHTLDKLQGDPAECGSVT